MTVQDSGGSYVSRSEHFEVTAPTSLAARRIASAAEEAWRIETQRWLGAVPEWPLGKRVPITVRISEGGRGDNGSTTFTFGRRNDRPVVSTATVVVNGRSIGGAQNVIKHEVMHLILAHHFGQAVPRWADEGIAVHAELDAEKRNHDIRCRELVSASRAVRLKTLFRMTEYPTDTIVLYAQGYSVVDFLLQLGGERGRAKLLDFVARGMNGNTDASWDEAARRVYGDQDVDQMESRWMASLRERHDPACTPSELRPHRSANEPAPTHPR